MSAPQRVSTLALREAVAAAGGNISGAARAVGIAKGSLYKRLHAAGINADTLAELREGRPAAKPRPRPLDLRRVAYVRPKHLHALREASFDLMAVLRRQMSTADVLELFIEEAFASWLAGRLERKAGE